LYIGEGQKFDLATTVSAISSIEGVSNLRQGNFIGAILECEYQSNGARTIVRISPDIETVTVEGLGDESLRFALELKQRLEVPLHAIDMEYSFNLALQNINTIAEFKAAISKV
jgi:hypothetical protein